MKRLQHIITRPEPVKWVFIGDSITHGAFHTFGSRSYVELFEERVRWELRRSMDIVINTAYSGETTRGLLATFDWRVKQFQPDVVFLMIGTNDCCTGRNVTLDEFTTNLGLLADRIIEGGALPAFQTTCPLIKGGAPDREPTFGAYMEAIRQVAQARDLPLIDHEKFWRERMARTGYWMNDPIHPNEFGHRAFTECLFKELQVFDPTSQTCRLFFP